MKFKDLLKRVLEEQSSSKEEGLSEPWSIEITKDKNKSIEYNELGDLIIKLSQIRIKMD